MSVSTLPADASSARADATRAAIVTAAEKLFRTLGYRKTTVADIARELAMSPANVYRFFASKSAINEAICARILTGLAELCWSIARGQGTPEERLRRLFVTIQEQTLGLFFNEKQMHDMVAAALEEHWSIIDAHVREIDTALRHIVMDGQACGDFARLDPDRTAHLLHFTTVGFTHPVVVGQCAGDEDLAVLARDMADFVIRALRP